MAAGRSCWDRSIEAVRVSLASYDKTKRPVPAAAEILSACQDCLFEYCCAAAAADDDDHDGLQHACLDYASGLSEDSPAAEMWQALQDWGQDSPAAAAGRHHLNLDWWGWLQLQEPAQNDFTAARLTMHVWL